MNIAGDAGVTGIMVPGISLETSRIAAGLSQRYPSVFAASGIHPSEVSEGSMEEMSALTELLLSPKVIAVGETGLDFSRGGATQRIQTALFLEHIHLAQRFGLPLIIHSRDAEEMVLELLGDDPGVPVVLHCYTGPDSTARKAVERGFYLGFTGLITYPGNGRLRELIHSLPRDRILAETDAPYLSPQKMRGKLNRPENVGIVAETLADLFQMDHTVAGELLLSNARSAFLLHPRRTDLVYRLRGRIYLNITGQCGNDCRFCVRKQTDGIGGYHLTHRVEPPEELLLDIAGSLDPSWSDELVFCGYGEPTMRPELLERLADMVRRKGFRVRLNTNGLCLLRMPREGVLRLLQPFDEVSVSLNASSEEEYVKLCSPGHTSAWESVLDFIGMAREVSSLSLSAVNCKGVDLTGLEQLAVDLGLKLRIRG